MSTSPDLLSAFRLLRKTERHHHLFLGGQRSRMEELFDTQIADFAGFQPEICKNAGQTTSAAAIGRINAWIAAEYMKLVKHPQFLELAVQAALEAAVEDRVQRLETSFNLTFPERFALDAESFLALLKQVHQRIAPGMTLCLDLGVDRSDSPGRQYDWLLRFLEIKPDFDSPAFRISGLDLYDVEDTSRDDEFRRFFITAADHGLTRKVHVGEFSSAEVVRKTVETLSPEEVQHGIHAGESREVARWLAARGTRLNVAPASNAALGAVDFSVRPHPLRVLCDEGVQLSLSTDDPLLFGASISSQAAELVETGIFTESEMRGLVEAAGE